MNNELERMQKEAVVAKLKVLHQNVHGGTEENHEKPLRIAGLLTTT
jgi:hypothetical protein